MNEVSELSADYLELPIRLGAAFYLPTFPVSFLVNDTVKKIKEATQKPRQ